MKQFFISLLEKIVKKLKENPQETALDDFYNKAGRFAAGIGVARDYNMGVKYFHMAAEQGNADAQSRLGLCYYMGLGVSQDDHSAIQWFKKAAAQGHADAYYFLGGAYMMGIGVEKNQETAVEYYSKAADSGHMLRIILKK